MTRALTVLLPVLLLSGAAGAATVGPNGGVVSHGIAMHGLPKYPADFRHLDHVNPDAPKGGTIRHAAVGTFDSLNPYIVKGTTAAGAGVNDPLMARVWDEPFSLYCLVCETVEVPADRTWVAFTLRPEARFHDGRPVTVDDVVWTFETLKAKGRPNTRRVYGKVTAVERFGERGVKFVFVNGDDREMPLLMGLMPVLPKHYWEGRDFEQTTLEPPLGSGAYKIAAVDPGRAITLERVRDYWGADLPVNKGTSNFDTIRYEYFRDDAVALEALKAGQVDFRREGDATKWATAYDVPAVKEGRLKLEELSHNRVVPMRGFFYNTRRERFADPRVRQALAQAFDFEWLNKSLLFGAFVRTDSWFDNSDLAARGLPEGAELAALEPHRANLPPEVFTAEPALPKTDGSGQAGLRANLRRATELLKAAGWTVQDGQLKNERGEPFAFEILLRDASEERIALEWARALERLGIKAAVRTVDTAQFTKRLEEYDYDVLVHQLQSTLSPGTEQMLYHSSDSAKTPGARNYHGASNPAIDALARGIGEAQSRDDLVARARALDRALLANWYVVPFYHQTTDKVAYSAKLAHPDKTPLYGLVIEHWWAKE